MSNGIIYGKIYQHYKALQNKQKFGIFGTKFMYVPIPSGNSSLVIKNN
jgi:hypothetical protein